MNANDIVRLLENLARSRRDWAAEMDEPVWARNSNKAAMLEHDFAALVAAVMTEGRANGTS